MHLKYHLLLVAHHIVDAMSQLRSPPGPRWRHGADFMMMSSNGNIFHVTGPVCKEFTSHRWIPLTEATDAELWCFLWSAPEQTAQDDGDLKCHNAIYDITVMFISPQISQTSPSWVSYGMFTFSILKKIITVIIWQHCTNLAANQKLNQ